MRVWTRSLLSFVLLGGAGSITVLSAASPARQAGAGTQVVVRAVTTDGKPILDLTSADVTIRVDGRQRTVRSLELVRPAAKADAVAPANIPAPSPTSMLPPPYATNIAPAAVPGAGREFVIAVDDDGIAPGRDSIVRQAIDVLMSSISPGDAVGVASMRRGGPRLAPTTDRDAVIAALGKITAAGSPTESLVDLGCRTKALLTGLGSLLTGAPANRSVLLFSSGVATAEADQIRESLGKPEDAAAAHAAICLIRQREFDDLGRLAFTSAAGLFVIFVPEAIANPTHLRVAERGLENVAGATGGEMVRMIGASESTISRIGETAGIYYLATLDDGGAAGPVRRVDARVNRDGARVNARPLARAMVGTAAKASTPKEMLRAQSGYGDLQLRAAAFVSRQPGANDLKVVALFEPEDASAKLTEAMVGLIDEKGILKAQWTAQPAELGRSPVVAALTAAPGLYRMRVAANDASGKGGATDYDLDARLPEAPPVKLSQMLLGVGQGGFAPKLAFTAADAAAIGFIEIYGVAKGATVEATFEIIKADGEVMGSGQGTVGAGPGDDARIAYGGFGIATLEPGDYTMRATINVDGKRAGVATRTLRKLK